MTTSAIDARLLSGMFLAGAANLEANKEWINELNVFPVPDGDTGTNMTLTIKSAVKEVSALGDTDSMKDICKARYPFPADPRIWQSCQGRDSSHSPCTCGRL